MTAPSRNAGPRRNAPRRLGGAEDRAPRAVRINAAVYTTGLIRITARVEYVAASGKRAQTLRATALRCTPNRATARPKLGFAG